MKIGKILAPTDFSPLSAYGVDEAVELYRSLPASGSQVAYSELLKIDPLHVEGQEKAPHD